MTHPVHSLADLLSEMPGIGPRQARRIVQFLLRANQRYKHDLVAGIEGITERVSQCGSCFRFDEVNRQKRCALCDDSERDSSMLMVVEKDVDIETIEQSGIYKGYYFTLGGLIPLARQRKSQTSPRIELLKKRLSEDTGVKEAVLAFATTPEGDHTAREIINILREAFPHLIVSQLGRGLSLGAEIEYADQETLRNAFSGRH